jgi:beta-lactamase regulating signal transducer with metallopeptidase domain
MTPIEWLSHPICRLITAVLLHSVWQGLIVALALLLMVALFRIRSSSARYAASLAALIVMIACPLTTAAWLGLNEPANAAKGALDLRVVGVAGHLSPLARLDALQPYILAAWFAGVSLVGSRLVAGSLGVWRLQQGRLAFPSDMAAVVRQLGRKMHLPAQRLVFLSRQVNEAMAVGLFRPLVLIPAAWATEMPVEMLEAVIAHELAHLRRRDLWINLLQRIVETLLFYHPAVWWLSQRLSIERELCVDEMAVAATGKRLAYARTLERIATQRQADIRPALAAYLRGETNMYLLGRIRNVLQQPAVERSRLWPAGIVALALPLGIWIAAALSVPAMADDDEVNKPTVRRDRDEGDRDRPTAHKEGSTDERRVRVEERVERSEFRKDGQPPKIVERRTVTHDGKPVVEVEFDRVKKPTVSEGRRIEELAALVKRLSAQVERLQDEVKQLRGERVGDKAGRESPEREEAEIRYRKLEQAKEQAEQAERAAAEKAEAAARKRAVQRDEGAKQRNEDDVRAAQNKERVVVELKRAAEAKERGAREREESVRDADERKLRELKENDPARFKEELQRRIREKQALLNEKIEVEARPVRKPTRNER